MKGLQHEVIEIRETQNEDIERILLFLKPGEHKIDVNGARRQAEDILRQVKVKKKKPKFSLKKHLPVIGACCFVAFVFIMMKLAGLI